MLKEKALTLTAPHPISHEAVKAASFARKIEPTTTEDVFYKLAALYLLNKAIKFPQYKPWLLADRTVKCFEKGYECYAKCLQKEKPPTEFNP